MIVQILIALENGSVHHVPKVASIISEVGALVNFLSPYSPDIEKCFSKVRSLLKSIETTAHSYDDLVTYNLATFTCITWICNIH